MRPGSARFPASRASTRHTMTLPPRDPLRVVDRPRQRGRHDGRRLRAQRARPRRPRRHDRDHGQRRRLPRSRSSAAVSARAARYGAASTSWATPTTPTRTTRPISRSRIRSATRLRATRTSPTDQEARRARQSVGGSRHARRRHRGGGRPRRRDAGRRRRAQGALLAYRVFGCNGGTATDVMIARDGDARWRPRGHPQHEHRRRVQQLARIA